ncbi:MAG: helix-turn-helix domain-containing protein [Bacilli bacterium]|nr:helix-turn-helix domain-containing protein [Bacilli bacterium]
MDPQKVGNLIKELRKNNGLTQKDLADKYGVTYQAVSKWENGTNLPDIVLIKQMCDDFNLNVNDFLDGNKIQSKSSKSFNILVGILIGVIVVAIIVTIVIHYQHKEESPTNPDIDLKKITTTCDIFKISGNLAYNAQSSTIRISKIEYCGGDDTKKYESIKCVLSESDNVIYTCEEEKNINLEDYLKTISIKVDNYKQTCKIYKEDTLMLFIEAKDNNKTTSYKIPLHLDDEC